MPASTGEKPPARIQIEDPRPLIGPIIERTFARPDNDIAYADNRLTPGAVPFEPSFSEAEPDDRDAERPVHGHVLRSRARDQ